MILCCLAHNNLAGIVADAIDIDSLGQISERYRAVTADGSVEHHATVGVTKGQGRGFAKVVYQFAIGIGHVAIAVHDGQAPAAVGEPHNSRSRCLRSSSQGYTTVHRHPRW